MRYFFNYRNDTIYYADGEGTELSTLAEALADARKSVRELLGSERAENDPSFAHGTYEITDDAGDVLSIIRFDELTAA